MLFRSQKCSSPRVSLFRNLLQFVWLIHIEPNHKTKVQSVESATVDPYTPPHPEPSPAVTRKLSFESGPSEMPAMLDDGLVKDLVATVSESATKKGLKG